MRDKDYYDGEAIWKLPAFGISAFNIPEAAEFVAKVLCLEGYLDKHVPDERDQYCLNNPILSSLLSDEIKEFQTAILSGVEKGTLETLHTSRDIHDKIDIYETYIDIDILHGWFSERGVEISGDFFADYLDKICEIHNAAIEAIIVHEDKIRRKIKDDFTSPDKEKIYMLERKIQDLELSISKEPVQEKSIHTKERNALYKIILGMAIKGYGYDPHASKSTIPKDIEGDLALLNINLTAETIRAYLKKAHDEFPVNIEKP